MQRMIIGFHQDEAQDWVANLACGHQQHVRHTPPWLNRPWVVSPEGRSSRLGYSLDCKHWDVLPGMNAGASLYAVPSPIEGSGTAWVLLGSWALSPARPTPIHPRHECRGFSALLVSELERWCSLLEGDSWLLRRDGAHGARWSSWAGQGSCCPADGPGRTSPLIVVAGSAPYRGWACEQEAIMSTHPQREHHGGPAGCQEREAPRPAPTQEPWTGPGNPGARPPSEKIRKINEERQS